MTKEEAITIAREFISQQPKEWRQIWPTKRIAVKKISSRKTEEDVWEVRSIRDGIGVTNIRLEVSPSRSKVIYALEMGGLRELPEELEIETNP